MVVDGIVQTVEHQQFVAELGIKVFVAQSALFVLRGRRELVRAVREDVAFL